MIAVYLLLFVVLLAATNVSVLATRTLLARRHTHLALAARDAGDAARALHHFVRAERCWGFAFDGGPKGKVRELEKLVVLIRGISECAGHPAVTAIVAELEQPIRDMQAIQGNDGNLRWDRLSLRPPAAVQWAEKYRHLNRLRRSLREEIRNS